MANIGEKKRVLQVRWAGCQQEEPAPTAGLGEKPAAKWDNGSWEMGQTDLMSCLEQQASFLISSGGERAAHTLLHWAVSDFRSRQG